MRSVLYATPVQVDPFGQMLCIMLQRELAKRALHYPMCAQCAAYVRDTARVESTRIIGYMHFSDDSVAFIKKPQQTEG